MNSDDKEFLTQFEKRHTTCREISSCRSCSRCMLYVRNYSAMEGLQRFCTNLKQFASIMASRVFIMKRLPGLTFTDSGTRQERRS